MAQMIPKIERIQLSYSHHMLSTHKIASSKNTHLGTRRHEPIHSTCVLIYKILSLSSPCVVPVSSDGPPNHLLTPVIRPHPSPTPSHYDMIQHSNNHSSIDLFKPCAAFISLPLQFLAQRFAF